ncbi:MAG: DUF3343 domain-containing protein [Huintestinicola sp.]
MKHTIAFASLTHANKAKAVFSEYGIPSEVIRTPKTPASGCGYSVIADAPPELLISIMGHNNLHYRSISESHGERMDGYS